MDLYGAMNQILENKKQEKKDAESQAVINYQQLLLKLSESTGRGDEKKAEEYARTAISIIKDYNFPHMEALIYYLLYSMYVSVNGNNRKIEETLDKAIELSKEAVEKNIAGSRMTCCQYLVTKANTFFFNKKFNNALQLYSEALDISKKDCAAELQISIYQMIGTCKRIAGDFDSWEAFVNGWKIVEKLGEKEIKNQVILRYYAKEMLKTGSSKERAEYEKRFALFWGEDWQEQIVNHEKENRKKTSVFSTGNISVN